MVALSLFTRFCKDFTMLDVIVLGVGFGGLQVAYSAEQAGYCMNCRYRLYSDQFSFRTDRLSCQSIAQM